jgi:phosphoglycerate dehydrogenase-like enzyme
LIYPESIPKRSLSSKIVYGRNQRLPEESQMTNEFRRPRVLVCDPIAEEGIALLREHADVEVRTGLNPEELLSIVFDFEGIIVRSRTRVDARVIRHAPRLKVIARAGAGLDNIDVGAAREKDIQVVNSPDANTLAVAEHTMGLLLALARRLMRADFSLKEGRWEKSSLMGTGLAGKTLGIIGFGRIGREVAIRARAFGMKILINQRRPTPELELAEGIRSVDLHDLLGESDFVTLHVPSRPENNLLIGEPELALMKPGAYLINTARGDILDEDALLRALDENRIMGAALDVFVEEPAVGSALAKHSLPARRMPSGMLPSPSQRRSLKFLRGFRLRTFCRCWWSRLPRFTRTSILTATGRCAWLLGWRRTACCLTRRSLWPPRKATWCWMAPPAARPYNFWIIPTSWYR